MLNFKNFKNVSYVKLICKCLCNKAPSVLCNLIKRHDDTGRTTRSTEVGNCRTGFCRTPRGQRAFSVKGSRLWNMLPNEFKVIHDIKSFTLKVKRWLKINQTCTHITFFIWFPTSYLLGLEEFIKLGACICFVLCL